MFDDYSKKASIDEIRARFDVDVERFSNLDTGQLTTIDAPITMDLCIEAAKYVNPQARDMLDVGCGAGNYTMKMLSKIPGLNCTLVDLSLPMLERAKKRVSAQTDGTIETYQQDVRDLTLPDDRFDIIFAAAVFHHLRGDSDWELVFRKMFQTLKPGGSLWISDLVSHESAPLTRLFEDRYGDYIESIGDPEYREKVFAYIEHEDTQRPLNYQLVLSCNEERIYGSF